MLSLKREKAQGQQHVSINEILKNCIELLSFYQASSFLLHFSFHGVKFSLIFFFSGVYSMVAKDKVCKNEKVYKESTIDFSSFLLSLSTQAFISLGEMKNPMTSEVKVNLDATKQVIDIICMLKERTKGNLEPSETKLLDNILYDLRLKYIEKTEKNKT